MLNLELSLSSKHPFSIPTPPRPFNSNSNSPLKNKNKNKLLSTVQYCCSSSSKSDNNTSHCCSESEEEDEEENSSKPTKPKLKPIDFSKLSVTLTVISSLSSLSSFPPRHALAAAASKATDNKKKKKKKTESLTPLELQKWSQGLPVVSDRLPYTQLLELKRDNRVRNIIKTPGSVFRTRPEVVLAVLEDDSRVLRMVLPSIDTDKKFWAMWDELGLDSFCVNAYTPPVKKPNLPRSYFGFLSKPPLWLLSYLFKDDKKKMPTKKAVEAKRMREELRREREEELVRMREENDMVEKAIKAQRKMEQRQNKALMKKAKFEESLRLSRKNYRDMASLWDNLAADSNVSTALGLVFFYIFYRTVVLSYKRQKKDYDDRLKMEEADAEERKKMRELEREMGERDDDDDELLLEEDGKGEQNVYMKTAMKFMRSGARVRKAPGKRPPQYLERGIDVKFSDVAGLGKIREELEEIVKFFTHGDMYRRRGVKIPGGILLSGPPGVGKTLLAKAVAGEAGVNFFSISASQFVEIYVGVGASRVRALYQEAKDNAPSVVFIDELDAVGRERGLIKGSGGQERDATLNQLLVCLDGFEGRGEVITIASTNRLDILDPALVRPGRFDRKIVIPKPGVIGRMEILKVHARKKQMAEDVDYMAVASMTDGMVGAELANILEIAAINMMRDGRIEITTDDLLQAAQIEDRGMLDRRDRSTEMWKQVAINEAAMAVVAVNFPDLKNIEFVNIAPRAGRELGYVRFKMDHMRFKEGLLSRQSLLDHITVQLAPRAADELWYGESQLSTIWAETADNARLAARTLVLGGLSEKHYGLSNFWVTDRLNSMDDEALRIMNMCYERAKEILQENRKLMDAVVDKLVEKKSLSKQDFFELVELHGSLRPMPPSIVDIRAAKRLEFQNMMMNMKEATIEGNVV